MHPRQIDALDIEIRESLEVVNLVPLPNFPIEFPGKLFDERTALNAMFGNQDVDGIDLNA